MLISSIDSLSEGFEDEYEVSSSDYEESEFRYEDLDMAADPAAVAANNSSIDSGCELAQQLHHKWEQQQDAVGKMLGAQQLDMDTGMYMVDWEPRVKQCP